MSSDSSLVTGAALVAAAVAFSATAFISSNLAFADEPAETASLCCDSDPRDTLRPEDKIATLMALHIGLNGVADGASYIWRSQGRLGGVIRPLSSFKDSSGNVCRHVVVALSAPGLSRQIEGIACRHDDGGWHLDG